MYKEFDDYFLNNFCKVLRVAVNRITNLIVHKINFIDNWMN